MNNSWINNLIEFSKTGNAGKCPDCGSENIEVAELDIGSGSKTFTCKDCKSFRHFDCTAKSAEAVT